jgi:putative aldouronate transport system permease protein
MVNTIWAMVIPNAVSAFNIIITRTFFQSTIPSELLEAAVIDGCSNTRFFTRIVLPLSMPIVAVMVLFSAVGHWNSYFQALIYLKDDELYPLQIVLRNILISNDVSGNMIDDLANLSEQQRIGELMKYGIIMVASLPVLILYPFVQKYFVKGVMIGSIKG